MPRTAIVSIATLAAAAAFAGTGMGMGGHRSGADPSLGGFGGPVARHAAAPIWQEPTGTQPGLLHRVTCAAPVASGSSCFAARP